jgi:hypothetical protein
MQDLLCKAYEGNQEHADAGARVLVWLAQLADDLRVPLVNVVPP